MFNDRVCVRKSVKSDSRKSCFHRAETARSIENNRSAYRDRLSLRGISERIGTRGNNVHTHKGVSLKIITFCQN